MYIKKMNYKEPKEFYTTDRCGLFVVDDYGFPRTDIISLVKYRYIKYEGVVPKNETWNLYQNKFDLYLSAGLISVLDATKRAQLIDYGTSGLYTEGEPVYMTHSKLKIIAHPCDEKLAWVPPIVFEYQGTLFSEDSGAAMGRLNWMNTTFCLFTTLIHGYKLSSSPLYQKASEILYDDWYLASRYGWDIDGLIALYDGIIKSGNQRLIDILFKKNHELDIEIYAVIFDYLMNNNLTNMTSLWPREVYDELATFLHSIHQHEKWIMLVEANQNRPPVDWSL